MTNPPKILHHLSQNGFVLDEWQQRTAKSLQTLLDELLAFKNARANRLLKLISRHQLPQGLYIWGSVGRGKTLLMDAFYQLLPYRRKRRIHFHALMLELDIAFRQHQSGEDPMAEIVRAMAQKIRVLCLDELTITALSDAMMFARLMHYAAHYGIVLITTSNVAPENLYRDGLQRERFLPAINLILHHCRVATLDSPTDYRLQKISGQSLWLFDPSNREQNLSALYTRLTHHPPKATTINIFSRTISLIGAQDTVLYADFLALCGQGRTVDDYQELVIAYHTWVVRHIPHFSAERRNEAKRFIWLIDVLYDHRALLIASAESPILSLFAQDINLPECERTVSRLLEMQSAEYQSPNR